MSNTLRHRTSLVAALWSISALLLLLGGRLLAEHVSAVAHVRASTLPLAEEIPQLQHRVNVIEQQRELSELSASLRIGSPEERVNVYALPAEMDIDKTVAVLDLLMESLRKSRSLASASSVEFGTAESAVDGIQSTPVRLSMSLHKDGIAAWTTFVRLCGMLTVADALTPDERTRMLRQTEIENPAAIVALEQYLNTDLLSYIREPRPAEDQLLRSFSSQSFERAFRDILRSSLLPEAQRVIGGSFAETLHARKLWPMQMMDIRSIDLESGDAADWYKVKMELVLYTRE